MLNESNTTGAFQGFVLSFPGRLGWTAGYTKWEKILWLGPLGIMFRDLGAFRDE